MGDLLTYYPRTYEDRSTIEPLTAAFKKQEFSCLAEVVSHEYFSFGKNRTLKVWVRDESTGASLLCFGRNFLAEKFLPGKKFLIHGNFQVRRGEIQSSSFDAEEYSEHPQRFGRVLPVYPLTEGLYQRSLRKTLYEVIRTQLTCQINEYFSPAFVLAHDLMPLRDAVSEMHFPASFEHQEKARRRIVFDELFLFEWMLLKKMAILRSKYSAHPMPAAHGTIDLLRRSLPFSLTSSQERAMSDISADMAKSYPMNRLLQGDVGSGKTVAAALALLAAAKDGWQGALLVPTEILAEQHYKTLTQVFSGLSVPVGLLTSSTPVPRREKMLADLKMGRLRVVVGTHALLQKDVQFQSLAVVVIDEQHKFGVHQRCQLLQRSPRPHQLVMTATPIPRTLALTIFGDLEVSTMKELPAGRKPVATYWVTREKQREVLCHILEKVHAGEQAYIIFPLIEETEKSDLLAAKREFDRLKKDIFASVKMGLVHGRVRAEDRESIMKSFRAGDIQVLVATSVVEVGVDNPNATVMVIENAERFGLSQLHQLRGRIGRGTKASECFLFGEPKTVEGQKRLRIMTKTQDGFVIAEEDLRLRGPGEFLGTRQSGAPLFKTADLIRDEDILIRTRGVAEQLLAEDPALSAPEDRKSVV